MWKSLSTFVVLLTVSTLASAEIYKCQKNKNETVYQNFPCHIDSIGSKATSAPPAESAADAAAPRPTTTNAPQSGPTSAQSATSGVGGYAPPATKSADGKYEPRIGMTRRQVRRLSWGEPEAVVETDGGETVWTYADKRVLRFDDKGRLVSVQR